MAENKIKGLPPTCEGPRALPKSRAVIQEPPDPYWHAPKGGFCYCFQAWCEYRGFAEAEGPGTWGLGPYELPPHSHFPLMSVTSLVHCEGVRCGSPSSVEPEALPQPWETFSAPIHELVASTSPNLPTPAPSPSLGDVSTLCTGQRW